MKLADLVSLISTLTSIPQATIGETARALQKAGHIQTGKPGRYGGAEMSSDDVAALVIAVIGAGERREVTTASRLVDQSKKMVLEAQRIHGAPEHDPEGPVEGDADGINIIYRELEGSETLFERVSVLVGSPLQIAPPFEIISYSLAMLSPMAFGVLIITMRNTTVPGQAKYLVASRSKEYFYRDPSLADHERSSYEVRRTVSGPFFEALHGALQAGGSA